MTWFLRRVLQWVRKTLVHIFLFSFLLTFDFCFSVFVVTTFNLRVTCGRAKGYLCWFTAKTSLSSCTCFWRAKTISWRSKWKNVASFKKRVDESEKIRQRTGLSKYFKTFLFEPSLWRDFFGYLKNRHKKQKLH